MRAASSTHLGVIPESGSMPLTQGSKGEVSLGDESPESRHPEATACGWSRWRATPRRLAAGQPTASCEAVVPSVRRPGDARLHLGGLAAAAATCCRGRARSGHRIVGSTRYPRRAVDHGRDRLTCTARAQKTHVNTAASASARPRLEALGCNVVGFAPTLQLRLAGAIRRWAEKTALIPTMRRGATAQCATAVIYSILAASGPT